MPLLINTSIGKNLIILSPVCTQSQVGTQKTEISENRIPPCLDDFIEETSSYFIKKKQPFFLVKPSLQFPQLSLVALLVERKLNKPQSIYNQIPTQEGFGMKI